MRNDISYDEIRDAIAEIGYTPRQRNVRYELLEPAHEKWAIEANHARYQQIRASQTTRKHDRAPALVPLSIVQGDSTA